MNMKKLTIGSAVLLGTLLGHADSVTATAPATRLDTTDATTLTAGAALTLAYDAAWFTDAAEATVVLSAVTKDGEELRVTNALSLASAAAGSCTYAPTAPVRFVLQAMAGDTPVGSPLTFDCEAATAGSANAGVAVDTRANSLQSLFAAFPESVSFTYDAAWATDAATMKLEMDYEPRATLSASTTTLATGLTGADEAIWVPEETNGYCTFRLRFLDANGDEVATALESPRVLVRPHHGLILLLK